MIHNYNQFIFSRERRRFGRQCLFGDRTQLMLSINPAQKLRMAYILRNPINRNTQLSFQKAHSWMETENVTFTEHGMYHFEGGWPRELNLNDEEQTLRHRKKIEREDNWGAQVNGLIHQAMDVSLQNSAINIYQQFFDEIPAAEGMEIRTSFEACQMNIFHDIIIPTRRINTIDWAPNDIRLFLAQHCFNGALTGLENQIPDPDGPTGPQTEFSFFIWNMKNPLKPVTSFESIESVRKAVFCPKDENFVAGGFDSGKVSVWDARIGGEPTQTSPLETAHRESMSSICWVHSKSNSEFYTGSYDGSIKYWDARHMRTHLNEILLDPESTDQQSRANSHGVTVLEFEYTIPVRYIICSDQGYVFVGNRKGMSPSETLLSNFKIFMGPIRTIERNPFFVKNFLVVGDWCAKVWAEECKSSPTTLYIKKKHEILCGTWSATRCSLFVTGDSAGELDVWDLLLNHRKPIFSNKFNVPILFLKFRPDGEYLGVALKNGDIHLLQLDEAVKRSGAKDKGLMAALFEREQLRCKLLDGRVEEMKLRRKTSLLEAEKRSMEEEKLRLEPKLNPNDPEQFIQIIENDTEFKEALSNFKDITLKIDKKRQEREYIMEKTSFEVDIEPEI